MFSLIIISAFLTCFLVFAIVFLFLFRKSLHLEERLVKIRDLFPSAPEEQIEKKPSFKERVVIPLMDSFKKVVKAITPLEIRQKVENVVRSANYPFGLDTNTWLVILSMFFIIVPVAIVFFISILKIALRIKILLMVVLLYVCFFIPNYYLVKKIRGRKKRMLQEFPDILDLLTVSMEAGASFDTSLSRVSQKSNGELAVEFGSVLNEIQLGKTRREALSNMAKRVGVPDISNFISSIIQAEQLGVGLGKILRVQSQQVRDKRRQKAREAAFKAPVKMLFPLVFFVFPTILVVILGPALLQIMRTMNK